MGECNYMGKFLPITFWGTLAGTYCFIGLFKWIGNREYSFTTHTLWIMCAQAFLQFFVYYNEDYFHISVTPLVEMIVLFVGSLVLAFPIKCIIERIPKLSI